MFSKDLQSGGLSLVSEVGSHNLAHLITMIHWNWAHGIFLFRLTDIFPWMDKYQFEDLPEWGQLKNQARMVGEYAKKYDQRITVHPSSFCVLASPNEEAAINGSIDVNRSAELFDYMGLERTPYNKINIHIGGVYGDKPGTLARFCERVPELLTESARSRLTVENDDRKAGFTVEELYDGVYQKIGIPIVFDYYHHQLNPGRLSQEEAMMLACSTWPKNITPIVHISSSKREFEDPEAPATAHADYVYECMDLHGQSVDLMLEAKQTEKAVLHYMKCFEMLKAVNE